MILDTSVLVALLRGDESVKEKIRECEENREPLRTTTVCVRLSFTMGRIGLRGLEKI